MAPDRSVVAVFGAGASMAAGGIGLGQILPDAFAPSRDDPEWRRTLRDFLQDVFGAPLDPDELRAHLPDLGLVLSLVDLAVERGQGLVSVAGDDRRPHRKVWSMGDLYDVREKLDGVIIATVLDRYVRQFELQNQDDLSERAALTGFVHEMFLDYLFGLDPRFKLISMNYDMFLERASMQHLAWCGCSEYQKETLSPNYDVAFEMPYVEPAAGRIVHKMHGSLDWAHCQGCGRIRLYHTEQYAGSRTEYVAETSNLTAEGERSLHGFSQDLLDPKATVCRECYSLLRPMIIAPTLIKNYSNGHIRHIWSHAERSLRACNEIFFVGYSLPVDDIEFIAMLKRHTQTLSRKQIHVISPDTAAHARYRSVFGPDIDVSPLTFERWVVENRGEIPGYDRYRQYKKSRLLLQPESMPAG